MPLDPQAQKVVDAIAALNLKPIKDATPAEAREAMRTRTAALGPVEDVPAVADHRVPVEGGEITVRLYAPAGVGPHPVLVYYHGGRWVIGEPVSRPGDYVEFRAEMDVIVGLSNCPLDVLSPCNGYHCTPVKIEVYAAS